MRALCTSTHGMGSAVIATRLKALRAVLFALVALGVSPVRGVAQVTGEGFEPVLAVVEMNVESRRYELTPAYVRELTAELGGLDRFLVLPTEDTVSKINKLMTASERRINSDKLRGIEALLKQSDELIYTNPRRAIQILDRVKIDLKNVMASIGFSQKYRQEYFGTLMNLAVAHRDNGNVEEARKVIVEVVRTFGEEANITEDDYHPDLVKIHRDVTEQLQGERRCTLNVRTVPTGAEVMVNGRQVAGTSPVMLEKMYPGKVTVAARVAGMESMVHRHDLVPGSPLEVTIDVAYEPSLVVNDKSLGFRFPSREVALRKIPGFAARVGSQLNVDYVLVAGLVEIDGKTHIDAHLVNVATGAVEREATLYTHDDAVLTKRVNQVAHVVSGMTVESELQPVVAYRPWYEHPLGMGLVGSGGALLILGAVAGGMYMDYDAMAGCDTCEAKAIREGYADTAMTWSLVAWPALGLGVAAVVTGAVLMVMDETPLTGGPSSSGEETSLRLESLTPMLSRDGAAGFGAHFRF